MLTPAFWLAGVLDEHFREIDAKDLGDNSTGFASMSGVNHVELFKWKPGVSPEQVVGARRTLAELATTVPSLSPSAMMSGAALVGRHSSADLALVAHFATEEELGVYERSMERKAAMDSIRPILAEAPTITSFGNDVPAVLGERNGASAAQLDSGFGEQVGQADYDAALEVLAAHDGQHTKQTPAAGRSATKPISGKPTRPPPPPPRTNPSGADEADAILEAHFAQTTGR